MHPTLPFVCNCKSSKYKKNDPEYDFIHINLIGHCVRLICVHEANKSENRNNIGWETELLGQAACSFDVITNFLSGWHNNFLYFILFESFQNARVVFIEFKKRRRTKTFGPKEIIWIKNEINGSKQPIERTSSWNPFWISSVFETVLETDLETLFRNDRLIWLGKTGKSSFSWFLSSSIIPLSVFKKRLYCFNSLLEF